MKYGRGNPFLAVLKERYVLNNAGSKKTTKHLVFDLGDSDITYSPGDSLAVLASNDVELVDRTLEAFGVSGEEFVVLKRTGREHSLRECFLHYKDISRVNRRLFRAIRTRQTNDKKRQFLEELRLPENKAAMKEYLDARQVWDILMEHSEVSLNSQELCDVLMPLVPRLYSVASSQKAVGNEANLAVALVEYVSNGHKRHGVCSHYLCDLAPLNEASVPIYVQKAHRFALPDDRTAPIIMVGPGTGVAPFRAFIQERIVTGASDRNWLFFGDWNRRYDFVYEDYWMQLESEGKLRVTTAFSRDQDYKIYVQDKIRENSADIWQWLQDGAYFYVCGDACRMARDVEAALMYSIKEHGGMSENDATSYIKKMKRDKRYQRDVY